MKKTSLESLEQAINTYLDTARLDVLMPFVGKCLGLEPFGEKALGDAINDGDFNEVVLLINKLSTFSETEAELPEETAKDLIKKEELAKTAKEQEMNKNTEARRDVYQKIVDEANQHKKSQKAKSDKAIYKEKLKNLDKSKEIAEDEAYLNAKQSSIENINSSEKRGTEMNISKRDLTKIMSAMKTINKHFAEEEAAESQVEDETPAVEDEETETEEVSTMIEIPSEKIDELVASITESLETAKNIVEDEDAEEEETEDTTTEDEEENEEFCGDSDEFMDFAEQVTETIENLSKNIESLSDKVNEKSEEYVENMSSKEFRQFAESVVTTIENLKARIDTCSNQVKNAITTNLDNLKDAGDKSDMFVSTIENACDKANESVVQNNEYGVVSNAKQFSEKNDRYSKVKDFLSL